MILENTDLTAYKELVGKIPLLKKEIAKVIVGQESVIEEIIITLLAGGHCLLEGVPGLAKTLMVNSLSQGMDMNFKRIQFTPDLMPGDILGTEILEEDHVPGKSFFSSIVGRSSRIWFWQMRLTGPRPKLKLPCLKLCRRR